MIRQNRILRTVGALLAATAFVAEATMAQESRPQVPEVEPPTEPWGATPIAADKKPNVVFILGDNVGYGDLGSYGGGELRGAPTPRLDQLAQQGVRLTQFLVEPACTPSRAALMTGQYSIRKDLSLYHHSWHSQHAPRTCLHQGRDVQSARVFDGHLREMASGRRTSKPSDSAWL